MPNDRAKGHGEVAWIKTGGELVVLAVQLVQLVQLTQVVQMRRASVAPP